jgi:hypothetical protein
MIVPPGLTKRCGMTPAVDNLRSTVPPGVITGFLRLDRLDAGAFAVFAGCTLPAPELILARSEAAVVHSGGPLSATIGVVLMLASCATTLGLGAFLLNRRGA